jgi:hypothetical protein
MQMIHFVSIPNLIQMKLMKARDIMKNLMNKEFQHFVQSQLIEVRIMKMQMIQFVTSLNLIQKKASKMIRILPNKRENMTGRTYLVRRLYVIHPHQSLSLFQSRFCRC